MSTPAVTTDASAVSQDTPNSDFLPEGEHYLRTGEVEEPKPKPEKVQPEKEDAPATSGDSETAAASEAADTQERKGPARSKTAATSESRWAKLSRENRELQEQLRQARESKPPQEREIKQEPQPAKANAEPSIDDVDAKTGQPKYATLKDYLAAHAKWNREEAVREFRAESEKTQREQQQQQTEQVIEKTVNERVAAVRKEHEDYDEAAAEALAVKDDLGRDALFYTKGSHLDVFFLDSDRGHEVLYAIFKDFDTHKHIFARDQQGKYIENPVRQLRELAKIENSLPEKGKPSTSAASRVTQAPRPPHQVSGKGTIAKDAVEQAVEENDTETYIREQNRKALERLKKGK